MIAFLLFVFFVVVVVSSSNDDASSSSSSSSSSSTTTTTVTATKEQQLKSKLKSLVESFSRGASGMPVNCRKFVDHFQSNGRLILPNVAGKTEPTILKGQRGIFQACEEANKQFSQVDSFASGKIFIAGNTVSFERTLVFVVAATRCRLALRGIVSFTVDTESSLIAELRDIYDPYHLEKMIKDCSWPEMTTTTTTSDSKTTTQQQEKEKPKLITSADDL